MELEVSYSLETEQQFWEELRDILAVQCSEDEHESIDNALRSYLAFVSNYKGEYIQTEEDFARCSFSLLQSPVFAAHKDYVRRQIVFSLLQEDSPALLHLIADFLHYDGLQNERTFEMMNEEGAFPRLLELIQAQRDDEEGLHRMLLVLMYEMARIQRLRIEDLVHVEDELIVSLFQIVEALSADLNDPYLYPVIRILLVFNEQYMVCAHDPSPEQSRSSTAGLTNKVIKTLAIHGSVYKSFGQNIILLLNREEETSLQLLILKLLFLLFTSPPTYEYFYTNDLHVLVDIILRNLLDLPTSANALRHTYLRVLYPLLSHSQLRYPPHYKRDDVLRLLAIMGDCSHGHFETIDETTDRLVKRCVDVGWISGSNKDGKALASKACPLEGPHMLPSLDGLKLAATASPEVTIVEADGATVVDASPDETIAPVLPERQSFRKPDRNLLQIASLPAAMASASSVVEVAAQRSKPGVITPRRKRRPPVPVPMKKTADGSKGGPLVPIGARSSSIAGITPTPTLKSPLSTALELPDSNADLGPDAPPPRAHSVSGASTASSLPSSRPAPPPPYNHHRRRLQSLGNKDASTKAAQASPEGMPSTNDQAVTETFKTRLPPPVVSRRKQRSRTPSPTTTANTEVIVDTSMTGGPGKSPFQVEGEA